MTECGCGSHGPSTAAQSITEMEWERGIWNAALNGETERVQAMLDKNPKLRDGRDGFGYSALHYASRSGRVDVVSLLLRSAADPNARTCSGAVTPIHRAAYMGRDECVRLLLKHGADPRLQDSDGKTALHKAVERGHVNAAELILSAAEGIDEIPDSKGKVPKDYSPLPK
jgi:ankyrin repeat protein